MNAQIVILGFHRSGTSVFTDYLNQCGLHIGDRLLGANPTNPRGHFEDLDFLELQSSILNRDKMNWLALPPYYPVYSSEDHLQATRLTAQRDAVRELWGFKDPRTCLYWDLWDMHMTNPVYVVPLRHYIFCIDSIQRRSFRASQIEERARERNLHVARKPDLIASSWLLHMTRVLQCVQKNKERAVVFDLPNIPATGVPARQLNKKFGLNLKALPFNVVFNDSLYAKTLAHPPVITDSLRQQCDEVWRLLMEHTGEARGQRRFVLKTDNSHYEDLRLRTGVAAARPEPQRAAQPDTRAPTPIAQLSDNEVASMFDERMNKGRYGRLMKTFRPILVYLFEKLRHV